MNPRFPAFAQPQHPAYLQPVLPSVRTGALSCGCGIAPAGQVAPTTTGYSPWLAGAIGVAIGAIGMHLYMK